MAATSVGVSPVAVAVDATGNVYLTTSTHEVYKIDSSGLLSTMTGASSRGDRGDGEAALDGLVALPSGVAVDASGNIFFADRGNHRVRRVSSDGVLTTVAGIGTSGFSGDGGPATAAALGSPWGLAVDHAGNLYIGDTVNDRIRKVSSSGIITTLPGTAGVFDNAIGLAVDAAGNVYATDGNRIRKISPAGVVTTLAGDVSPGFSGDGGVATGARLSSTSGIALDASGNIFIADQGNQRVRRINSGGIITTVAGNGVNGFSGDGGLATNAALSTPSGVAVDQSGNILIAETGNNRIRRVTSAGVISTLAGNGSESFSGDGGPANEATIASPTGVARDGAGNLYVADQQNHRVRKIDAATGVITTIVGDGTPASTGDGGPAMSARTNFPSSLAVDRAGNLYLGEAHRIRKIDPDGIITAFAGNGSSTYSGDNGPATSAGFFVAGIAVDAAGNLFIADQANNRIRRVSDGIITTVAGTGVSGSDGDGGAATLATLRGPTDVVVDGSGNLYIADRTNSRIRRVSADGIITTVAGTGVAGLSGDGGLATGAMLRSPVSVALDGSGALFMLDQTTGISGTRIRKVAADGIISTVAGGPAGYVDGPAMDARFGAALDLIADAGGNLVVADAPNNRVREVVFTHPPVADAGPDQTIEWQPAAGNVAILLDGSASSDDDGDTLSYEWRNESGTVIATTPWPQVTLTLGTYTFTLTVSDGITTDSDSLTIDVKDTIAPQVTLTSLAAGVTSSSPIPFHVLFSEPVTGFDLSDILAVNGVVTAFGGAGTSYSFAVVPAGQGSVTVHVMAGAAFDGGGNASNFVGLSRIYDTVKPAIGFSGLHTDSVFQNSSATLMLRAIDANGIAAVNLNSTPAILINGTPQDGNWRATVAWSPLGPFSLRWSATDVAGNLTTVEVPFDNDGIDQAIDKNAATLADESGVFSGSFVYGPTAGRTYPAPGKVILASVATASEVSLRAVGSDPSPRFAGLCTGASKSIHLYPGNQAFVRCSGTTLYLTAVNGTIKISKHTSTYCSGFSGCTYYYTDTYVPQGGQTSLGSPVTANPANTEPIVVQLVRVIGGLTPPEPDSEVFQDAEIYGDLVLEAGESVDIQVTPGDGVTTPDSVTMSVLSGTVDITVRGETQTVHAGGAVQGDASPRSDQAISFGEIGDQAFGAQSFAVGATATSGLPVSFSASGSCAVSGATISLISAGTCSITAMQTGDASYRPAASVTRTFNVLHSWSNLLPPVNVDGTSVFRLGSTVPVKFRLTGGSAGVTTLAARITVTHASSGTAAASSNANAGNLFRYDPAEGQYIFNWNTKGLSDGTWQIRVDLQDGAASRVVAVTLRR